MNLLHSLAKLLGGGVENTRPMNFGGGVAKPSAPVSPAQQQAANAQIEADGARMFNQAHPGQFYRANQNHEFAPGQLPSYMEGSIIGRPGPFLGSNIGPQSPKNIAFAPSQINQVAPPSQQIQQYNPYNIQNFGNTPMNIQGQNQNPGAVPYQGSKGPGRITNPQSGGYLY